jgi:hypothetical protein
VVIVGLDGIEMKLNPETGQYLLNGKAVGIIVIGKAVDIRHLFN